MDWETDAATLKHKVVAAPEKNKKAEAARQIDTAAEVIKALFHSSTFSPVLRLVVQVQAASSSQSGAAEVGLLSWWPEGVSEAQTRHVVVTRGFDIPCTSAWRFVSGVR